MVRPAADSSKRRTRPTPCTRPARGRVEPWGAGSSARLDGCRRRTRACAATRRRRVACLAPAAGGDRAPAESGRRESGRSAIGAARPTSRAPPPRPSKPRPGALRARDRGTRARTPFLWWVLADAGARAESASEKRSLSPHAPCRRPRSCSRSARSARRGSSYRRSDGEPGLLRSVPGRPSSLGRSRSRRRAWPWRRPGASRP